jgi:hypothetical protein
MPLLKCTLMLLVVTGMGLPRNRVLGYKFVTNVAKECFPRYVNPFPSR